MPDLIGHLLFIRISHYRLRQIMPLGNGFSDRLIVASEPMQMLIV